LPDVYALSEQPAQSADKRDEAFSTEKVTEFFRGVFESCRKRGLCRLSEFVTILATINDNTRHEPLLMDPTGARADLSGTVDTEILHLSGVAATQPPENVFRRRVLGKSVRLHALLNSQWP
jgi:hypothetical protein